MTAEPPVSGGAEDRPRAWETGGRRRPPYRGVKWAQEYTGVGRRTVHRRVDAWLDPEHPEHRTPYAIRSSQRPNARKDRLIDPVDAERVRLQELGQLDGSVTTEEWDRMIAERRVPYLSVTNERWFAELLRVPPAG
jgi:hypothetical protein